MEQEKRQGKLTSSQAYRIVGGVNKPTKPFFTYAEEVALERILNRPVTPQADAKSLRWGSLMECIIFDCLPMSYSMTHKNTIEHKKYGDIWAGTPDYKVDIEKKTGEIKCYYIKNWFNYMLALKSGDLERIKEEFPQPYWQVVSNAMLNGHKKAELLTFIPTKEQLENIIVQIEEEDFLERNNLDPKDYYFYTRENIEYFNYLPNEWKNKNLVMFEFDIPIADRQFLLERILKFRQEVEEKQKELTQQL